MEVVMTRHALHWFEIPIADLERARRFYEGILETSLTPMDLGEEEGLRMLIFPTEGAGVGGALCHHPVFYRPSEEGCLVYLNADPDLDGVLDRIRSLGGTVLVPKTRISEDQGYMAVFRDSEGNRVALHSNA
jgi:uncharacterized protein